MEMTRRRFWSLLAGGCLAGAAVLQRAGETLSRNRFVQAVRCRTFPGKTRPFDEGETRRQSKWAG